jgi:site-specific DNA-methyltransferase (adenine-specific)
MEKNKIYCGDNIELIKQLEDKSVDLTVTSPPYSNIRKYDGATWDFETLAQELHRVTKDGGCVCWIVNDQYVKGSRDLQSFKQAIYFKETCGFNVHDVMIYQKSGFNFPSNTRYHQVYEYIHVLSKGKLKTFNPLMDRKNLYPGQKVHGNHRLDGNTFRNKDDSNSIVGEYGKRFNVWYVKVGSHVTNDEIAYKHPAIFPESLCGDLISSFSNENDLVFDPFIGSGTTAKMAKLLKRDYLGFEVSEEYCKIAEIRLGQSFKD